MPLSNQQRKYLKGLCHDLKPVVTVADKGVSATIGAAIDEALNHHELIKVKVRQERDDRARLMQEILEASSSEKVMSIGQVLCLYRANPNKATDKRIKLPKA